MNSTIAEYIKETNHWHEKGRVYSNFLGVEREEYINDIFQYFNLNKIIAVLGIRRSGKSTLLFESIQKLIDNYVDSKKILYIKTDDFENINELNEVLETYESLYGFNLKEDKCYIFIDEIQFHENWQQQLKYYIDYKYACEFIISGSSKTLIYNKAKESLVGRIVFITIFPLTFREFLKFNGIIIDKNNDNNLENITFKKLYIFKHSLEDQKRIKHLFLQYLRVGGFPEWFEINNESLWRKLLSETYVDLLLYKDIVKVYNIKNPKLLEKLFYYYAKKSGERISYNKISQFLDIDRETVKIYTSYLESARLLLIADKFTKNDSINEKSEKKIYIWEEGMRRAISHVENNDFAYENVLLWNMQKYGLKKVLNYQPKYYHKNYEIDYVYREDEFILPIEVKNSSSQVKIKGLKSFISSLNISYGITITEDRLELKDSILFIPLWLFLLYID